MSRGSGGLLSVSAATALPGGGSLGDRDGRSTGPESNASSTTAASALSTLWRTAASVALVGAVAALGAVACSSVWDTEAEEPSPFFWLVPTALNLLMRSEIGFFFSSSTRARSMRTNGDCDKESLLVTLEMLPPSSPAYMHVRSPCQPQQSPAVRSDERASLGDDGPPLLLQTQTTKRRHKDRQV